MTLSGKQNRHYAVGLKYAVYFLVA